MMKCIIIKGDGDMEIRSLTLEAQGTTHQLKTILRNAADKIEMWEKTQPDIDHWWAKGQGGGCLEFLDVKLEF